MIEDILEQALRMNEIEKAAHFARLAQTPEASLKELAALFRRPVKPLWSIALQAIGAIGYPQNSSVLPLVVDHLTDGNWPGWDDAIHILEDIDPAITAPLLLEILLDRGKTRGYWSSDVEGICAAFTQMNKDALLPCIPALLFILTLTGASDDPDPGFVLRALEHAGISEYSSALPTLIYVADVGTNEETRAFARRLLRQFSPQDLALYQRVTSFP